MNLLKRIWFLVRANYWHYRYKWFPGNDPFKWETEEPLSQTCSGANRELPSIWYDKAINCQKHLPLTQMAAARHIAEPVVLPKIPETSVLHGVNGGALGGAFGGALGQVAARYVAGAAFPVILVQTWDVVKLKKTR